MNLKYIIGILALLILMVGTASAATYILTEANTNVNRDDPGTLPTGIIKIVVTYDEVAGKITYLDQSPSDSNGGTTPYIVNPKIDWVAYNLPIDASSILAYNDGLQLTVDWVGPATKNVDGFGTFSRVYTLEQGNYRPDKVVVTLANTDGSIPLNEKDKAVALHLAFEGAYTKNDVPILEAGKGADIGSTFLASGNTEIPEFPTVALPVAAILGLMFIFGRRKKE